MEKRISFFEFQSVKAVAKAINPLLRTKAALKSQIEKLIVEYHMKQKEIEAMEAGVVNLIGFHVDELVQKVVENSTDKNGKTIQTTKYLPTDNVTYDNTTKQYVISIPDDNELPTTSEAGSDFDADKESVQKEEEELFKEDTEEPVF